MTVGGDWHDHYAPWMQFYLQSSIVDKGITVKQYKASRLDVIVGSIFTDVVAWFIIVACAATLVPVHGIHDIPDAATLPRTGDEAAWRATGPTSCLRLGLFNASLFAASILPLSTAYTVCEGLGFESGLDKTFSEAKFFYWFYTLLIAPCVRRWCWSRSFRCCQMVILSQVLNGVLLPVVLIFMLRLINKHELMGKYTNRAVAECGCVG